MTTITNGLTAITNGRTRGAVINPITITNGLTTITNGRTRGVISPTTTNDDDRVASMIHVGGMNLQCIHLQILRLVWRNEVMHEKQAPVPLGPDALQYREPVLGCVPKADCVTICEDSHVEYLVALGVERNPEPPDPELATKGSGCEVQKRCQKRETGRCPVKYILRTDLPAKMYILWYPALWGAS
jgi:hypothetical protein